MRLLAAHAALLAALLCASAATPSAAQTSGAGRAAARLSLWGTLVPVAAGAAWWATQRVPPDALLGGPVRGGPALLIAGGLVVGPSLGYLSADLGARGMRGAKLRTSLTLLTFIPAMAMCGWDCGPGDTAYDLAWLAIATGSGLSVASAIHDISTVERHVRDRERTRSTPELSAAPTYDPRSGALGIRVALRF